MHPITERILTDSYTLKEAVKRLRTLQLFFEFMFFSSDHPPTIKEGIAKFSEGKLKEEKKDDSNDYAWLYTLQEEILNKFSPSNIHQIAQTVKNEIEKTKTVTVYLAFDPKDAQSSLDLSAKVSSGKFDYQLRDSSHEIGTWLKSNIDKKLMMDIRIDPNLIGGCALSFGGKYKDFSLRDKITKSQEKIIASLMEFKR